MKHGNTNIQAMTIRELLEYAAMLGVAASSLLPERGPRRES